MNIHKDLDDSLEYISLLSGVTISLEERLKLEIALNELYKNIKSEEIFFWGKIIGVERDYYIATAVFYKNNTFPVKKFYFCNSNNFVFSLLPEVMDHHIKTASTLNNYFIGIPETILEFFEEEASTNEAFNPNDFDSLYKRANKKKNFTETDRLAYIVRNIEFDCSIVPSGAYKYIPLDEIRPNDNFQGLKENELTDLKNYMHFRPPITEEKKELIKRGEAIMNFNFLDDLAQDNKKSKIKYKLF